MTSEVYKKFRHQSLMSDFDSLLSEMDGDLDCAEEAEFFATLSDLPPPNERDEISPLDDQSNPFSLSDLPPPDEQDELSLLYEHDGLSPLNEQYELSPPHRQDELPLFWEGEEFISLENQHKSDSADVLPHPEGEELPPLDEQEESSNLYESDELPPLVEPEESSPLEDQCEPPYYALDHSDSDFPQVYLSASSVEQTNTESAFTQNNPSMNLSYDDEIEVIQAFEAIEAICAHGKVKHRELKKTDSLDFTDADNAIDKMLDELQDFSFELMKSIPDRNSKDDEKDIERIPPEVQAKATHDFSLDNLELSVKDFEDNTDVDLDALLNDLCAMEMELTAQNPQPPSSDINKKKAKLPSSMDPLLILSSSGLILDDVRNRLNSFREEMRESKELTEEENEAKIKSEKIRIALEKMKAASARKIFIKVFNNEKKTNKTFMVDSSWTARDVKNKMVAKDDVEPNYNWCIMEKLPNLFIERILEDSECILQTVLAWPRDSNNILVFLNRRDKYMLFRNPQNILLSGEHSNEDAKLAEKSKDVLLREYFIKDNTQIPPLESVLWLQERPRKWLKHFCVLRASGIYYNAKGKNKVRSLSCLTSFENNVVYLGVGFKKIFKAPTDHVLCLKHPKIQTTKSKHIFALCADEAKIKERWIMFIRMAKYGYKMYEDFIQTQEELEDVFLKDSVTNQVEKDSTESSGISKTNATLRRKVTSLNRRESCIKATPTGAANRIEGKQNALGLKFSMAWKQGVIVKAQLAAFANAQKKLESQSATDNVKPAHVVGEEEADVSVQKKYVTKVATNEIVVRLKPSNANVEKLLSGSSDEKQMSEEVQIYEKPEKRKDAKKENFVSLKPANAVVEEVPKNEELQRYEETKKTVPLSADQFASVSHDIECNTKEVHECVLNDASNNCTDSLSVPDESKEGMSVDDLLDALSSNLINEEEQTKEQTSTTGENHYQLRNDAAANVIVEEVSNGSIEEAAAETSAKKPELEMSYDDHSLTSTISALSVSSSSSLESLEDDFEESGNRNSSVPQSVDELLAELACGFSDDEGRNENEELRDPPTNLHYSPPDPIENNEVIYPETNDEAVDELLAELSCDLSDNNEQITSTETNEREELPDPPPNLHSSPCNPIENDGLYKQLSVKEVKVPEKNGETYPVDELPAELACEFSDEEEHATFITPMVETKEKAEMPDPPLNLRYSSDEPIEKDELNTQSSSKDVTDPDTNCEAQSEDELLAELSCDLSIGEEEKTTTKAREKNELSNPIPFSHVSSVELIRYDDELKLAAVEALGNQSLLKQREQKLTKDAPSVSEENDESKSVDELLAELTEDTIQGTGRNEKDELPEPPRNLYSLSPEPIENNELHRQLSDKDVRVPENNRETQSVDGLLAELSCDLLDGEEKTIQEIKRKEKEELPGPPPNLYSSYPEAIGINELHRQLIVKDAKVPETNGEAKSVDELLAELSCDLSDGEEEAQEVKINKDNLPTFQCKEEGTLNEPTEYLTNEVLVLEMNNEVPHLPHLAMSLKSSNGLITNNLMREVAVNLVKRWIETSKEQLKQKLFLESATQKEANAEEDNGLTDG